MSLPWPNWTEDEWRENTGRKDLGLPPGEVITMPFADYVDFDDCVAKNSDKDDPKAYCGWLKHRIEGSAAPETPLSRHDMLLLLDWNESAHPRDEHGRFTDGASDTALMAEQIKSRREAKPNPEFHRAINEYTWSSGDMNAQLWKDPNNLSADARLIQDEILAQPPFEHPVVVYRGLDGAKKDWLDQLTPGTTITMNGFQSTTPADYTAKSFGNVVLRINATRGLVLDQVDKLRVQENEQELLLPHQSKFRVRGRHTDGKFTVVDVDQQ